MGEPRRVPLHSVILAGGSGTRFWPLSRRKLPKQFLALAGEKTLLRETYERLEPLSGAARTWVVTGAEHVDLVQKELPEIPPGNVLGEPVGRNTAPCIGLSARAIAEREPDAMVLVCPSDHIVRPPAAFRDTVRLGASLLEGMEGPGDPWTVTFGIVPRYPSTGFGYIERGEPISPPGAGAPRGGAAFRVERFREKPPQDVARAYVESGKYSWNSGIFLWKAAGVLGLIERHIPLLATGLAELGSRARGPGGLPAAMGALFGTLPSISIDYGVLEHTRNVAVVAADFEWDDVGSWRAVERYTPRDEAGNSVVGRHVGIDTRECTIVGQKRLVCTIGVENLVIVETGDAILVCSRDETERVKEIVEKLRSTGLADLT